MLSLLMNRNFRCLFTAQIVALAGTGLSTVALALLAYDLAGNNAGPVLGTALAIKMVAYVGLSPIAGVFTATLPRKPLLVTLDLLRAAVVFSFPFIDALWQVYLLIFLLNASSACFKPIFQSIIPEILSGEDEYIRALSMSRMAYDLENLLSPTIAALALTFMSYPALFIANSIAFVISALLVTASSLPQATANDRPESVLYNLCFGIRAYLTTPRLRGLFFLCFSVAFSGAFVIVNTVVYVRDFLNGSDSDTALALAASGAGSMLVALLLPRLLKHCPERPLMLTGGLLSGAGLVAVIQQPSMTELCLIWFSIGAAGSMIMTPAGRLVDRSCKPTDRSAYFSAQFALSHACWLIAYPLAGWIGSVPYQGAAIAGLAIFALGATLIASKIWPKHDLDELPHHHKAMCHEHLHVHDEHHQHDHDDPKKKGPHSHEHSHKPLNHLHPFVIDHHHQQWPKKNR